jgi:V8-like Glu-specific endopeptidase
MGISEELNIRLYEDDEFQKPKWFIHPLKGYLIDVIAIPLISCEKVNNRIKFFPINKYEFDKEFPPEIADDVFILGYPFNITDKLEFPIWKRGTIASEPSIDIDDLPKVFVDTATRSGMSGSPVIMKRTGIHGYDGKQRTGKEIIGTIYNFIGIYSGRIGADDEFKAQLGVVWREEVILEILKAKKKSDIKFQMI